MSRCKLCQPEQTTIPLYSCNNSERCNCNTASTCCTDTEESIVIFFSQGSAIRFLSGIRARLDFVGNILFQSLILSLSTRRQTSFFSTSTSGTFKVQVLPVVLVVKREPFQVPVSLSARQHTPFVSLTSAEWRMKMNCI